MLKFQESYRRHLPHIQPPGANLFVTFRLAGSLPKAVQNELLAKGERVRQQISKIADPQEQKKLAYLAHKQLFGRWDDCLDTMTEGEHWLKVPEIAQIVEDSLHHLDDERYFLDCFCIMSNHVHVVFQPVKREQGGYFALSSIMHSLKRYTAVEANKILGRKGQFWQHESYDHVVCDGAELARIRNYVLGNPVKAGLVESPDDWPWTYYRGSSL